MELVIEPSIGMARIENVLVSIVVPVYNVSQYLDECVASLLAQSHQKIEVILVDDGSSDGSELICDEWANRDSRVRVLHQRNCGLSAARNAGIESSIGEYITFVDSDDFVDPEMVKQCLLIATLTSSDVVVCGYDVYLPTGEVFDESVYSPMPFGILSGADAARYTLSCGSFRIVCGNLYSVNCLGKVRFQEGRIHEDYDFPVWVFKNAKRVFSLPLHFYHYRRNRDNSIMAINKGSSTSLLATIEGSIHNLVTFYELAELDGFLLEFDRLFLMVSRESKQKKIPAKELLSRLCGLKSWFDENRVRLKSWLPNDVYFGLRWMARATGTTLHLKSGFCLPRLFAAATAKRRALVLAMEKYATAKRCLKYIKRSSRQKKTALLFPPVSSPNFENRMSFIAIEDFLRLEGYDVVRISLSTWHRFRKALMKAITPDVLICVSDGSVNESLGRDGNLALDVLTSFSKNKTIVFSLEVTSAEAKRNSCIETWTKALGDDGRALLLLRDSRTEDLFYTILNAKKIVFPVPALLGFARTIAREHEQPVALFCMSENSSHCEEAIKIMLALYRLGYYVKTASITFGHPREKELGEQLFDEMKTIKDADIVICDYASPLVAAYLSGTKCLCLETGPVIQNILVWFDDDDPIWAGHEIGQVVTARQSGLKRGKNSEKIGQIINEIERFCAS